ncbi:transglycosylase SLT domain-containing protein [Vibrio europaeus]|uniref:transglycosylase SLT domain-containing protein n=1 Tax=Vibrio europaeus TaxID=300876 RepID=UPI00233EAA3F|nr:transporter substrate-binding domain-containing protein [Vibrio europaeus]
MRMKWWFIGLLGVAGIGLWVAFPIVFEPDVIRYSDMQSSKSMGLEQVKRRGVLRVATRLNGIGCFYKRGELRGLECEVLKAFAEHLGVHIQVVYRSKLDELLRAVDRGQVDIVAADLTPTVSREHHVRFSEPILETREVLIHRRDNQIHEWSQLAGKTITVRRGTTYEQEVEKLAAEVNVYSQLLPSHRSTLDVIRGVAEGEWSYTIVDEHIARSANAQFSTLAPALVFGEPRGIAFALAPSSTTLRHHLNQWLTSKQARAIVGAYQEQYRDQSESSPRALSAWDHYFQKYAEPPFSWLWLAAQAYSESAFDPKAVSPAGAQGIMQLMPETAVDMQVLNVLDPAENIRGGSKYNHRLYHAYWRHLTADNALAFTFASYNAGVGHVLDAQRLALRDNADPNVWFGSVERYIVLLEQPQYYALPFIRYGYCRGSETKQYVKRIFDRYQDYRRKFHEDNGAR